MDFNDNDEFKDDDYEEDDLNDESELGEEYAGSILDYIAKMDAMFNSMNEDEIDEYVDDTLNNKIVDVNNIDELFDDRAENQVRSLASICENSVYEIILKPLVENTKLYLEGDKIVNYYEYDLCENLHIPVTGYDKLHTYMFHQYNDTHNNKACYFDDIENGQRQVFLFDDLKESLKNNRIEMEIVQISDDGQSGVFKCTTNISNLNHLTQLLESVKEEDYPDLEEDFDYEDEDDVDIEIITNDDELVNHQVEKYVMDMVDSSRDELYKYILKIIINNHRSFTSGNKIVRDFAYKSVEEKKPENAGDYDLKKIFNRFNNTHKNKAYYIIDDKKWEYRYFLIDDLIAEFKKHGFDVEKGRIDYNNYFKLITDISNIENIANWYNELDKGNDINRYL